MKLKNSVLSSIGNIPLFTFKCAKKASENRVESLSGSVVEKETPTWKPLSLLIPTLIVISLFTLYPLAQNIFYAFSKEEIINKRAQRIFTFDNFRDLINYMPFSVGLRNSLMYGLIVLPFTIGISLLLSSLIATLYRKTAKGFWQTIFFLPYVTNAIAVSLTFIQMFDQHGLFNKIFNLEIPWLVNENDGMRALFVLLIKGVWSGLAFNILIFTTAMLSVDKNLYRSASIDGIGGFKQFFSITLPSIKSTTTFLVTMGIIGGIKIFPLALFNNRPDDAISNGASSLMLLVYDRTNAGKWEAAGTAAIMLFIIGVLFSTLIRKGFGTIVKASINLGEYNVWNKIKDSKEIRQLKAKKR